MTLALGTRLGPYEILSPLGAGGMGEVYRARDTRLGRDVAIKVLPLHLSANAEVRTRFEREARTVSALNHPNICTLFDVGREGDTDFLVMELVEGETLTQRLTRGALPIAELLRVGAQIADALDRAHRAGVIHRDLKPGNVMLTRSGAKLMDFGLARATGMTGPAGGSGATIAALTQTPTVASPLTAEGTIVGTFQYMSPEQLEGGEADARSDLWALGCVLYEMATGRRAFEGRSQASLIAAILEREPASVIEAVSGSAVPGTAPQALDRLVRACLAKDPEQRLQTAHDVKLQLQWVAEGAGLSSTGVSAVSAVATARTSPAPARLAWGIAALAVVVAVAAVAWLYPRATAPRPVYRFRLGNMPGMVDTFWPRVSPDGRMILVETQDSTGNKRAWVRPLDQFEGHPVAGTDGLQRAYWSPDSREIVFVASQKIQRVSIAGGTPTVICAAPGGADLSWGARGTILMDGRFTDSLRAVPAGGGELKPASRIARADHEIGSAWPCFLPDGEHFLFVGNRSQGSGTGSIRLGKLGSLDSKLLGDTDGRAEYAPGGWVVYLKGTTLLARKLDLGAGKLTGEPITAAEDVRVGTSAGHYSVSRSGVIAYAKGDVGEVNQLQSADRTGRSTGTIVANGTAYNPALSPDGTHLLYQRSGQLSGRPDEVYVRDLERGTETRLAVTDAASNPVWSPDGRRFACALTPANGAAIVLVSTADGLGTPDTLRNLGTQTPALWEWTASGSRLLYFPSDLQGIFSIAVDSTDRKPVAMMPANHVVGHPAVSPDGRWMAYTNGDDLLPQVYVQSLVGPPGRWQISVNGGYFALWTKGGRELVFEDRQGKLMAVDIDTKDTFRAGTPQPLFALPTAAFGPSARTWTCSADGERFILAVPSRLQAGGSIDVVSDFGSIVHRR